MSFVHFYCAIHQRPIDGGFDLDRESFQRMRLEPVHVFCPLCAKTHRYLLGDAIEAIFERHELQPKAAARR